MHFSGALRIGPIKAWIFLHGRESPVLLPRMGRTAGFWCVRGFLLLWELRIHEGGLVDVLGPALISLTGFSPAPLGNVGIHGHIPKELRKLFIN